MHYKNLICMKCSFQIILCNLLLFINIIYYILLFLLMEVSVFKISPPNKFSTISFYRFTTISCKLLFLHPFLFLSSHLKLGLPNGIFQPALPQWPIVFKNVPRCITVEINGQKFVFLQAGPSYINNSYVKLIKLIN